MQNFELVIQEGRVKVHAQGSTRPALAVAALRGMLAAAGPRYAAEEEAEGERREKPFSVRGNNFSEVLAGILNAAAEQVGKNIEAYDDIRFTLITETQAEGAFSGRPVAGFGRRLKVSKGDLAILKNDAGAWESDVELEG